ncbi:MAG: HAD family hydrolase [Lachnospiraceae bacterium]|nr:HAD family hydrolase [Lachnospiraceae bacterium]
MVLSQYNNFIFDLYGTLIDVRTDEHADETWIRWAKWLDEHDIRHPSTQVMHDDFFGMDRAARDKALAEGVFAYPEIDVIPIYRTLFEKYGNPSDRLTNSFLDDAGFAFRVSSREYIRLFPGVKRFLKSINSSGKHAYILSNAQRCYTLPEIHAFGLHELVSDVLISSDHGCMKPDTAFYNMMILRNGLDRDKTVMIGDSRENDYEGGIGAGINAIWLNDDNPATEFYNFSARKPHPTQPVVG